MNCFRVVCQSLQQRCKFEASSSSTDSDTSKGQARKEEPFVVLLSWIAERNLQQAGRTNRANQRKAPKYWLVTTNLPGERRIASIVYDRIARLGALTNADRRTCDLPGLSQFSLDRTRSQVLILVAAQGCVGLLFDLIVINQLNSGDQLGDQVDEKLDSDSEERGQWTGEAAKSNRRTEATAQKPLGAVQKGQTKQVHLDHRHPRGHHSARDHLSSLHNHQ